MSNSNQKNQLEEKGYVILKNLLTEEEIEKYRKVILTYIKNDNNNFFYSNGGIGIPSSFEHVQGIRSLLKNKKIFTAIEKAVGKPIVYLHHCDVHYNRLSGWHRDTTGYLKNEWEERNGSEEFKLYKIAFYLQDHTTNNAGLTVEEGSHKTSSNINGEIVDLKSEVGDAILFDQRIKHIGQFFSFPDKVINTLFKHNQQLRTKVATKYRKLFGISDKMSIFWGVGVNNQFSKEFAENIVQRQNKQLNQSAYKLENEIVENLESIGVNIIDIETPS